MPEVQSMILAVAGEVTGSVVAAQEIFFVDCGVVAILENSTEYGWLVGWLFGWLVSNRLM